MPQQARVLRHTGTGIILHWTDDPTHFDSHPLFVAQRNRHPGKTQLVVLPQTPHNLRVGHVLADDLLSAHPPVEADSNVHVLRDYITKQVHQTSFSEFAIGFPEVAQVWYQYLVMMALAGQRAENLTGDRWAKIEANMVPRRVMTAGESIEEWDDAIGLVPWSRGFCLLGADGSFSRDLDPNAPPPTDEFLALPTIAQIHRTDIRIQSEVVLLEEGEIEREDQPESLAWSSHPWKAERRFLKQVDRWIPVY